MCNRLHSIDSPILTVEQFCAENLLGEFHSVRANGAHKRRPFVELVCTHRRAASSSRRSLRAPRQRRRARRTAGERQNNDRERKKAAHSGEMSFDV